MSTPRSASIFRARKHAREHATFRDFNGHLIAKGSLLSGWALGFFVADRKLQPVKFFVRQFTSVFRVLRRVIDVFAVVIDAGFQAFANPPVAIVYFDNFHQIARETSAFRPGMDSASREA